MEGNIFTRPTETAESTSIEAEVTWPNTNDLRIARKKVKANLPNIPFYDGVRLRSIVLNESKICVEVTLAPEMADGDEYGGVFHHIVDWPDLSIGERTVDTCANRVATFERINAEVSAHARKMLRMASQLEQAITAIEEGHPAEPWLYALNEKINRINDEAYGIESAGSQELAKVTREAAFNISKGYGTSGLLDALHDAQYTLEEEVDAG